MCAPFTRLLAIALPADLNTLLDSSHRLVPSLALVLMLPPVPSCSPTPQPRPEPFTVSTNRPALRYFTTWPLSMTRSVKPPARAVTFLDFTASYGQHPRLMPGSLMSCPQSCFLFPTRLQPSTPETSSTRIFHHLSAISLPAHLKIVITSSFPLLATIGLCILRPHNHNSTTLFLLGLTFPYQDHLPPTPLPKRGPLTLGILWSLHSGPRNNLPHVCSIPPHLALATRMPTWIGPGALFFTAERIPPKA